MEENKKTKRELKREHARLTEKVLEWVKELQEYRQVGQMWWRGRDPRDLENIIEAGIKKLDSIVQQM